MVHDGSREPSRLGRRKRFVMETALGGLTSDLLVYPRSVSDCLFLREATQTVPATTVVSAARSRNEIQAASSSSSNSNHNFTLNVQPSGRCCCGDVGTGFAAEWTDQSMCSRPSRTCTSSAPSGLSQSCQLLLRAPRKAISNREKCPAVADLKFRLRSSA